MQGQCHGGGEYRISLIKRVPVGDVVAPGIEAQVGVGSISWFCGMKVVRTMVEGTCQGGWGGVKDR